MKKIISTLLMVACISTHLTAQPLQIVEPEKVGLSSNHLKYTDAAIESEVKAKHIPGAVLAVVKDGKIAHIKAFGNKSLTPTVEPMSINTVFDLASCTKPLATALSAMILVERGKLSLRDNLDFYIPDFNKNRKYAGESCSVRVANLLTHTSGIQAYVPLDQMQELCYSLDINSLVEYIKNEDLKYKTGEGFRYSCPNYIILQYIIEQITSQSLYDFAKENIYNVLGLTSTGYLPLGNSSYEAWCSPDKIAATEVISPDSVLRGIVHDPLAREVNGGVSGNSGLFSTAADIAVIATALLNEGVYNGKRILHPSTVRTMRNVPTNLSEYGRANGWDVSSIYSSNIGELFTQGYGHTGFTGCSLTLDDENNMAVILLTNGIHAKDYQSKYLVRLRAQVANSVAASVIPTDPTIDPLLTTFVAPRE